MLRCKAAKTSENTIYRIFLPIGLYLLKYLVHKLLIFSYRVINTQIDSLRHLIRYVAVEYVQYMERNGDLNLTAAWNTVFLCCSHQNPKSRQNAYWTNRKSAAVRAERTPNIRGNAVHWRTQACPADQVLIDEHRSN